MKGAITRKLRTLTLLPIAILLFAVCVFAQAPQATPPPPTAPRTVQFPKPVEKTLPNGLRVVVVQRSEMPLISSQLLIKSGGGGVETDASGRGVPPRRVRVVWLMGRRRRPETPERVT